MGWLAKDLFHKEKQNSGCFIQVSGTFWWSVWCTLHLACMSTIIPMSDLSIHYSQWLLHVCAYALAFILQDQQSSRNVGEELQGSLFRQQYCEYHQLSCCKCLSDSGWDWIVAFLSTAHPWIIWHEKQTGGDLNQQWIQSEQGTNNGYGWLLEVSFLWSLFSIANENTG